MDYDEIQQAALDLDFDERVELVGPLLGSIRWLFPKSIEQGKDVPLARRQEALKKSGCAPESVVYGLAQAALHLPAQERDKLATKLIHSVDEVIRRETFAAEERDRLQEKLINSLNQGIPGEEVSEEEHLASWIPELDRRIRESDEGKIKSIPWDEVKRKGRELLGEI